MAHNHYRIPVRLRHQALKDLAGSEKEGSLKRSKCRRHRRKLRYLMHLYEIRQRRYRWMETHVWHAKRFKMVNIDWNSGCRIPLNCNDKSLRSIYKLCQKESACIMDQSYYNHFLISQELVEELIQLQCVIEVKPNKSRTSLRRREFMIYNDEMEKQLVGLFDIIMVSPSMNILVMHPSITTAVYEILSKKLSHLSSSIKPIYLNNFSIISKSVGLQHIFNVFSPIAEPSEAGPMNTIQASNYDDALFSENQVVVFNVSRG